MSERDAMTLQDCTAILTPLALAMRAEMDGPSYRAYYQALKTIPGPLLKAAVDGLMAEGRTFMPNAGEIRQAAEHERTRLLSAHPYEGCAECEDSKGFVLVRVNGLSLAQRCGCFARHREKLAALGVGDSDLALPSATRADA